MRRMSPTPTLVLTRVQFYEDCTVGRLCDPQNHLLCMTLEPRWGAPLSRQVTMKGPCCIVPGIYRMYYEYDYGLKYLCWHTGRHHGNTFVRLCFLAKGGSVAAHTQGDILLGYLSPEGDEERAFEGQLYRPMEAFERLLAYYAALRANHGDFRLQVKPVVEPVSLLPAVEAPDLPSPLVQLKDYLLQTL